MTPPATAPGPPPGGSSAVEGLAGDMVADWRAGDRRPAEAYLDRYPGLWQRPDAALELIAEELALREEAGDPTTAAELVRRFPQWADQVRVLYECQQALGSRPAAPEYPAAGDALGEFRLVAELGRGAHGRVYLASQGSLGGRAVVLKLGPAAGGEHLSLARLQHTHVVPLYSAHEFPARGLRALCLPYFGGLPLSTLLAGDATNPPAARSGAGLVAALRAAQAPVPAPVCGAGCEYLERASWAEAVCWVGACLADALEYAHARGLLHLDLKPSNVLVAADGTPMLLDFHLARPPLAAGDPAPGWLGGTPGYMPPEQAAALAAVRAGEPVPAGVDARADVYALGVLLAEALGCRPEGRGHDGGVSVGLSDVLARCTAPAAADRYPSAAALAADLRRHLSDLPLRGVGNRSLAERWGKWRRRRPYALPLVGILAALAAAGGGFALLADRQAGQARAALRDGEEYLRQRRYAEAAEAFRGGEALAAGWPFPGPVADRLRQGRQRAERGTAAADLHLVCDRARPLYAAETLTPAQARTAAAPCRMVWEHRAAVANGLDGQPDPDLDRQWRADLLDLGILLADLEAREAAGAEGGHRRALAVLDQAEALLGPAGALYQERAAHARALGLADTAAEADRLARVYPPRTALEHLAAGRAYLGAGDAARAAVEMARALDLDPGSVWANYYAGVCDLRLGDPTGAVAAFTVCVRLAPRSGWCFYNLGLAEAGADRTDRAVAAFDRALALDPGLAAAAVGRAAAHLRAGRFADALADVRRAADAGLPPADAEYQTALIHLARGDRAAAAAALRSSLARDPGHATAREALTRIVGGR